MITRPASLLWFLLLVGGGRMLAQLGGMSSYFDYPYKEVLKTLHQIEDLEILFELEDTKIVARHGDMFLTLLFDKGTTYQAEYTKTYDRIKKAQEAYDGCMDYFLCTGAVPIDFCEDEDETQVIATRNGNVFRLSMIRQQTREITVTFSRKWVNLAPPETLEGPDFMELNDAEDDEE
jgi:hypothetical protein